MSASRGPASTASREADRQRGVREIVTPEGVALPFQLASIPDRVAAFAIDFLIVHVIVVAVFLVAVFSGPLMSLAFPISLLTSFFLRNFYFTFFEIRWGGATIGKRKLSLRVVSRDGGPVTSEAIFARNLTRDLEVFMPLVALMAPSMLMPGLPEWAALLSVLWIVAFATLPLLNRDRMRIGDILAGTLVVRMPEARLLPDMAVARGRPEEQGEYSFTQAQLDLYGIKELQVLEDVLRRNRHRRDRELIEAVAQRIRAKIGWPEDDDRRDWAFLNAFYAAQRGRLEHKMLFGKRQEQKRE